MSTYNKLTGRLPPHSILQQRYLIVSLAGRGGMSAVYRGVDTKQGNRSVAIKEMSQGHLTEAERAEALGRFRQEYHLLKKLQHPNLPLIYDTFNEEDRFYFVMDFIDGNTLLDLLKANRGQPLPIGQVVDYAIQLCDVLSYLHIQTPPVIFRDLKPTNVMIRNDGRLFLIDFGIARLFKEGQQQDTILLGSPGYAPPEQHGSGQTSPRSDIYALGATMHCCLTGRDPFHATDRFVFPPISQFNPLVPADLDRLIQRMLALNERQRPTSAQEVKQALLHIKQQAAEHTTNLSSSAAAYAPTQFPLPTPAPLHSNFQAPANNQPPAQAPHLPTVPVGLSRAPSSPTQPAPAPIGVVPQARSMASLASIWTRGFLMLFAIILILTVGGSLVAFNIPNPYGSDNPAGVDHAIELGLSIFFIIVAFAASAFVRSIIARAILFISALVMVSSAFAFLVQTVRDIQMPSFTPGPHIVEVPSSFLSSTDLAPFLVAGLIAAAVISLLWLLRPFQLLDRVVLLVSFGIPLVCTVIQIPYRDDAVLQQLFAQGTFQLAQALNNEATPKHLLLIVALIMLILGVLIAAQTERVKGVTK